MMIDTPSDAGTEAGLLEHIERAALGDRRAFRGSRTRSIRRLAFILLSLGVVLLSARSSIVRMYRIGGPSMAPTLCVGDGVWINLAAYDLRIPFTGRVAVTTGTPLPGEMVMCTVSGGRQEVVKRVLAAGGDSVEMIDGRLAVNGKILHHERLDPEAFRHLGTVNHLGDGFATETIGESEHTVTFYSSGSPTVFSSPVTVPDGHFFLIGDNRASSWDSRYPEFGCVPRTRILGRAIGEGRSFRAARGEYSHEGAGSSEAEDQRP